MSDFVPESEYPKKLWWGNNQLTVADVERRVAPWSDAQCRAVRELYLHGNGLDAVPACVLCFERLEL